MLKKILSFLLIIFLFLGASGEKKKKKKKNKKRRVVPAWSIREVERDKVICFALYTVNNNILKLTAQLYPLKQGEDRIVRLEIKENGIWKEISRTKVNENKYFELPDDDTRSWTAHFRIEKWDMTKDHPYRVRHGEKAVYEGLIRKDPVDKNVIKVAGFTGNSNRDRKQRNDIIKNIKAQDVDLLFFSGDQSYDHRYHLDAWLLFGRQFGEIIKDRPTICLPDDHDVGQGNIWGAGGKKASSASGNDGGYYWPVRYVNEVQRAQTSHMPDPYDPTPIRRNISVYYTAFNWGGVSFAVIEDRKWKTGPKGLIPKMGPRPDHINDPDYDPKLVDVEGAVLYGERQLKFLREWAKDWKGIYFKTVLSQTVLANAAHLHGSKEARLVADLDSNGWPQSGRNRALKEMRKCFAFHLNGDQHLATVIHHGIENWNDSSYSFCVPSIVNYYPRSWMPLNKGKNREEGSLEHAGEFLDPFRNKITMKAYANPNEDNYKAAGYGLVKFNKKTRKITMECWPRKVDVTDPNAKQFPGWPITIDQADNYAREPAAFLPLLDITGTVDPIVQVIYEKNNEIVYTLRIKGNSFRPKVFKKGKYTIIVKDDEKKIKRLEGINSLDPGKKKVIKIKL